MTQTFEQTCRTQLSDCTVLQPALFSLESGDANMTVEHFVADKQMS